MQTQVDYYELSLSQRVMYYALKYSPKKNIVNIGCAIWFDQEIDLVLLEDSIYKAISRMDAMKLRLTRVGKVDVQYISNEEPDRVKFVDFKDLTDKQIDEQLTKWTHIALKYKSNEMYDIKIFKRKDNYCGVYVKVNHVIMDAWGLTVFCKDILSVYNSLVNKEELPTPPNPFIPMLESDLKYAKSERKEEDFKFWKDKFSNPPAFAAVDPKSVGKEARKLDLRFKSQAKVYTLSAEKFSKIKAFCTEHRVSPQALFLLGCQTYLTALNNKEEVLISNVVARRASMYQKNAGGMMINIMPFKIKVDKKLSFLEACEQIADDQFSLFRHSDFPYQEIMDYIQATHAKKRGDALTDISLTYQVAKIGITDELKYRIKSYSNGSSGIALYLTIMDYADKGSLDFIFEYRLIYLNQEQISRIYYQMLKVIELGMKDPNMKMSEIESEIKQYA